MLSFPLARKDRKSAALSDGAAKNSRTVTVLGRLHLDEQFGHLALIGPERATGSCCGIQISSRTRSGNKVYEGNAA